MSHAKAKLYFCSMLPDIMKVEIFRTKTDAVAQKPYTLLRDLTFWSFVTPSTPAQTSRIKILQRFQPSGTLGPPLVFDVVSCHFHATGNASEKTEKLFKHPFMITDQNAAIR